MSNFKERSREHVVQVQSPHRRYLLNKPLKVTLTDLCGGFFAEHATLPVSGYGETEVAAIDAFAEAFDVQYRALVTADASGLSDGAQQQALALRSIVQKVEACDGTS